MLRALAAKFASLRPRRPTNRVGRLGRLGRLDAAASFETAKKVGGGAIDAIKAESPRYIRRGSKSPGDSSRRPGAHLQSQIPPK
jgi:hypothetical protein